MAHTKAMELAAALAGIEDFADERLQALIKAKPDGPAGAVDGITAATLTGAAIVASVLTAVLHGVMGADEACEEAKAAIDQITLGAEIIDIERGSK